MNDVVNASRKPSKKVKNVSEESLSEYIIKEAKDVVAFLIFSISTYATLTSIFGISIFSDSLVEGNNITSFEMKLSEKSNFIAPVFSLFILLFCSTAAGYIASVCRLPPLLGQLIAGILLRNITFTHIELGKHLTTVLRQTSFTIILLRGGLDMDAGSLKKLKGVCIGLATIPCSVETIAIAILSKIFLGMPWTFGFLLGFVLAAVSPAVVVPEMLRVSQKGYGVKSGVPTLVIAAAGLDDLYAIAAFTVCQSIAFSEGVILQTIIRTPLVLIAGTLFGIFAGFLLWYIPSNKAKNVHLCRTALLLSISTLSMFGDASLNLESAGPIAVLVLAFIAGQRWSREKKTKVDVLLEEESLARLWNFIFQPLLFTLIGFELSLKKISWGSAALGTVVLSLGCVVRLFAAFMTTHFCSFTINERIFIAISWLPKATVQAALAAVALDTVENYPNSPEIYRDSTVKILTVSVLSILITAPLGAFIMRVTARRLLTTHHP